MIRKDTGETTAKKDNNILTIDQAASTKKSLHDTYRSRGERSKSDDKTHDSDKKAKSKIQFKKSSKVNKGARIERDEFDNVIRDVEDQLLVQKRIMDDLEFLRSQIDKQNLRFMDHSKIQKENYAKFDNFSYRVTKLEHYEEER